MSAKPRIIGLDIGDKRIGVAISDPLHITAAGLETIERVNMRKDLWAVIDMARRHGAVEIVVGLPQHLDGQMGEQAQKVLAFGRKLTRFSGLPVIYEDEYLSTVTAIRTLTLQGVKTGNKRELIDRQAAAVILQRYLDRRDPQPTA